MSLSMDHNVILGMLALVLTNVTGGIVSGIFGLLAIVFAVVVILDWWTGRGTTTHRVRVGDRIEVEGHVAPVVAVQVSLSTHGPAQIVVECEQLVVECEQLADLQVHR